MDKLKKCQKCKKETKERIPFCDVCKEKPEEENIFCGVCMKKNSYGIKCGNSLDYLCLKCYSSYSRKEEKPHYPETNGSMKGFKP